MTALTGPLISAAELGERLDSITVLDVRYQLGQPDGWEQYAAGHVPGAAYVDLDADLADPPGAGGRHPLPDPDRFVRAMRAAGVTADRTVVVYDDWNSLAAGRAWWLLRHYGHPDVRVLDGAWPAWLAAAGPVETGEATPTPGDFDGRPGAMPVVEADAVPDVPVLIDVRAPERYRGEIEPLDPVAGHIPGAHNVPLTVNLDGAGRFRDPAELAQAYAAVGATPPARVAAYCGSGITATQAVLAMELAGISAALYPGSWSGWVADRSRPVER